MLLTTSSVFIFKFSPAVKHNYLLKYLIENPDIELCTYLNDRSFSIYTRGSEVIQKVLQKTFAPLEYRWILKKNSISRSAITRLRGPQDIKGDDIVLSYNICSDSMRGLSGVNAFKALCMIHFGGNKNENEVIQNAGIACYYNEVNLELTSEIYRRYYNHKCPWICIPFVYSERFKDIKPFSQRKNKAFSVGTITYKNHPEFLEVYGDPCDQPIRKLVKDNQDYFSNTADSYSSDYLEDDDVKELKPTDNIIVKVYKRVHNRFNTGRQKKYFSFNMVEKFNEYKMHIVGEEILGIPGIGYVEGMACGSAYIGLDSPMYRDLGLIPGVHYIAYDGTKEGLRSTIEYWQRPENQLELEKIAATGCKFVRENFRGEKVAHDLIESLKVEQQKWLNSRK
jgi:hypothetical protein